MFRLEIEQSEILHTSFGTAKLNKQGYYIITTRKENNHSKLLHRLIWEKWYGELDPYIHIHHLNENKRDNCLWNLEPIIKPKHHKLHKTQKVKVA